MDVLFLVGLLVSSGVAIVTAKTKKWKLLNISIILAGIALGFVIKAGLAEWVQPMRSGAYIAIPLGTVGALRCWRDNRVRDKLAIAETSNE